MTAITSTRTAPSIGAHPASTSIDDLSCSPAPDLRPAAVRWHRPPESGNGMVPLPLHHELTGGVDPAAAASQQAGLDAVRAHARSLLVALVDAIQGRRPAAQLTRWVGDGVMAEVTLRARLHQRAPRPLAVRSMRVQPVDESTVEVAARLQAGDRFTAAALRLERIGTRWFCPVADFGPLPKDTHPFHRVRESDQRRL